MKMRSYFNFSGWQLSLFLLTTMAFLFPSSSAATQIKTIKKFRKTFSRTFQYFLSRRQKVDKTISLAFSLSALNAALDGCRKKTITETIE